MDPAGRYSKLLTEISLAFPAVDNDEPESEPPHPRNKTEQMIVGRTKRTLTTYSE